MHGSPFVRAPNPLAVPFRPRFSPVQVIARTLSLWTKHAVPFFVVTLVVHAPATIFVLARGEPTGQFGALDVVQIVLGNVLALVTAGVLTSGALRALRGEEPRIRILLAVGVRRLRRIVLASVAYGVVAFVATLLLVVPGIIAAVGMYVAPSAVVAEPSLEPTRGALKRSWALTAGRRLEVFAILLAAWLVSVLFAWVASAVGMVLGGPWWVGVALSELLTVVASSVFNAAPAIVYRDLRLEKEGIAAEDVVKVVE